MNVKSLNINEFKLFIAVPYFDRSELRLLVTNTFLARFQQRNGSNADIFYLFKDFKIDSAITTNLHQVASGESL